MKIFYDPNFQQALIGIPVQSLVLITQVRNKLAPEQGFKVSIEAELGGTYLTRFWGGDEFSILQQLEEKSYEDLRDRFTLFLSQQKTSDSYRWLLTEGDLNTFKLFTTRFNLTLQAIKAIDRIMVSQKLTSATTKQSILLISSEN